MPLNIDDKKSIIEYRIEKSALTMIEAKTKHPVMATVADNITALYDLLKRCPDVRSFLEWNEGGHFREPALRTARAFVWAVGW